MHMVPLTGRLSEGSNYVTVCSNYLLFSFFNKTSFSLFIDPKRIRERINQILMIRVYLSLEIYVLLNNRKILKQYSILLHIGDRLSIFSRIFKVFCKCQ